MTGTPGVPSKSNIGPGGSSSSTGTTEKDIKMETFTVEQLQKALEGVSSVSGAQTMDIAPAAMIEIFKGDGTGLTINQLFDQIDQAAILGRWKSQFKVAVLRLKCKGPAEAFLSSKFDFSVTGDDGLPTVDYEVLRKECKKRFQGVHTDQYHFMNLQGATQKKGETVQQFAERVRHLGTLTIRPSDDEREKEILRAEAERRMLASFLNGLSGKVREITKYKFPEAFEKAIDIAVMVESEEISRPTGDDSLVFSINSRCWNCGNQGHMQAQCRSNSFRGRGRGYVGRGYASARGGFGRGQGERERGSAESAARTNNEGGQSPQPGRRVYFNDSRPLNQAFNLSTVRCFRCARFGHMIKDCRVALPSQRRDQSPLNRTGPTAN